MSKPLRYFLLATVAVIVIAVALIYWQVDSALRDCYAQWWFGDLVVLYLKENDQQWPSSWEDLRRTYESKSTRVWSYDELRSRIEIDWTADPKVLRAAPLEPGKPPFHVIRLRSGALHHWETHEPNQIVWEYLQTLPQTDELKPR